MFVLCSIDLDDENSKPDPDDDDIDGTATKDSDSKPGTEPKDGDFDRPSSSGKLKTVSSSLGFVVSLARPFWQKVKPDLQNPQKKKFNRGLLSCQDGLDRHQTS